MPSLLPLNRESVEARLLDLGNAVAELDQLAATPQADFVTNAHTVALASYYLQRAIEDILGIGTHLLARLPTPVTVEEYRDVVPELARAGIVSTAFATRNAKLGSYRNRLVHHYLDVTPEEIYRILTEHRTDLVAFGRSIRAVLEDSAAFNFTID